LRSRQPLRAAALLLVFAAIMWLVSGCGNKAVAGAKMQEILIPGGDTWVGSPSSDELAEPEEMPIHKEKVKAFYIDSREVTFAEFKEFVDETGHVTTAEKAKSKDTWRTYYNEKTVHYPVFLVSRKDAVKYAEWKGKRLPTEAEWERAARGDTKNIFPWGNEWGDNKCANSYASTREMMTVLSTGGPIPAGVQKNDVTPGGVRDLAGNVAEWTEDRFEEYVGSDYETRGVERKTFVLKGGSWGSDGPKECRIAHRGRAVQTMSDFYVGFRCARDAK
jgi:sulfatase modifying factor 1